MRQCYCLKRPTQRLTCPLIGGHASSKEMHSNGLTESVQRILIRRALTGQHPQTPAEIIGWLEATARGWNRQSLPRSSGAVSAESGDSEHDNAGWVAPLLS